MSTVSLVIVLALVVFVLAAFSPPSRRLFRSIGNWWSAQADRAAESVAKADPVGVYKTQIANYVEKGKKANAVVEAAGKRLVILENQIAELVKEQTRLTNRISGVMTAGDPNKTAVKYAGELARVEEQLKSAEASKSDAQQQYDENLKLVERFQNQISEARKDAAQLGQELERSQAEKDLYQMTAALKDQLNVGGDLAEARQRVKDQVAENQGAMKAARDLAHATTAEYADDELERDAAAKAILERFKKPAAQS